MELETLFVEQKWNILKLIATKEASPIQIAEAIGTTIANVSQQLKLLEAMGLVKKKKISNRDKGKPRVLYSLNKEFGNIIALTNGYVNKRLMALTDYHKTVLRIWFIGNEKLHSSIQYFLWEIESITKQLDAIIVIDAPSEKTKLIIFSSNQKEIEPKILKKKEAVFANNLPDIEIYVMNATKLENYVQNKEHNPQMIVLYDREGVFEKKP